MQTSSRVAVTELAEVTTIEPNDVHGVLTGPVEMPGTRNRFPSRGNESLNTSLLHFCAAYRAPGPYVLRGLGSDHCDAVQHGASLGVLRPCQTEHSQSDL